MTIKIQNNNQPITVDILGTLYVVSFSNRATDGALESADGFADVTCKTIVVNNDFDEDVRNVALLNNYQMKVLRHELVHAFLYESGLSCNSWGDNEEIVDWIAIQLPKIFKALEKVSAEINSSTLD